MPRPYHTLGSSDRIRSDRFDAVVTSVGFVLHRHRPEHWAMRRFANARYDILALAVAGRARYQTDTESFDARRGTMLFFPRGTAHAAQSDPDDPWSFYSVGFVLEPASPGVADRIAALDPHRTFGNTRQLQDLFEQLDRAWNSGMPGFSMACRGLVMLLMQQYLAAAERRRHAVPHAATIEAVVERMHQHVGRVDAVGDLARQAGLSESRFRDLFKAVTGCSVTRYQNRLRIQAAQDLLADGSMAVGEVAEELGFRDVYYFSRLFKRFTGVPPSSARRT